MSITRTGFRAGLKAPGGRELRHPNATSTGLAGPASLELCKLARLASVLRHEPGSRRSCHSPAQMRHAPPFQKQSAECACDLWMRGARPGFSCSACSAPLAPGLECHRGLMVPSDALPEANGAAPMPNQAGCSRRQRDGQRVARRRAISTPALLRLHSAQASEPCLARGQAQGPGLEMQMPDGA